MSWAMRRACLLVLWIVSTAVAPHSVRVRWQQQRFADCNGALLRAAEHPTVGWYQYRLRGRLTGATVMRVPHLGYRGVSRITYSLDPASTVMILPRWTWGNMTQAQNRALADFVSALRNHELGHRDIAERALSRSSSVSVISTTPALARRDLLRALAAQLQEEHLETQQAEKTYDRVTGHGTRQSEGPTYGFRGGPDVTFRCP